MAERVGINLASTESPAQLEALTQGCARCQSQERCDDWLHSSDDDSSDGADYRNFCLNTDTLDRLWMRGAVMFDRDRLQSASYKTDIHPDREVRPREVAESEDAPPTAGPLETALSAALRGDYATALGLWRPLAEQGSARAQRNLGVMYHNGQGVPQDYAAAAMWIGKAADQGDPAAQHNLAFMYDNEQGVPQDPAAAVTWYRKAAEQGHAGAQSNLGFLYRNGHGVSQDNAAAFCWYRKAAEQGNAVAQLNLGFMYRNGHGVPRDDTAASNWYRKAAEQGNAIAQLNLGWMHYNGQGVAQDYAATAAWYRKAADQGLSIAQLNLAAMYDDGLGVPEDYVQAHKWYNLAAARFPASQTEERSKALAGRERLARKMTPAQITEAQKLARTWMPI
jgi:TPR repeat protein